MFKLFLLLEMHTIDVLCVQETWLPPSNVALQVPGYNVYEQRRATGTRGGIATLVRKGIKIIKESGNEFAQAVQLQLPNGDAYWVCNTYLPPMQNLARRGVGEAEARAGLLDVLAEVSHDAKLVVCGDFNARVGEHAPTVQAVQLTRTSEDKHMCTRGNWILHTCAELGLHILNGAVQGGTAQYTCIQQRGSSVVDYILCRDSSLVVQQEKELLAKLTDHTPLHSTLPINYTHHLPH